MRTIEELRERIKVRAGTRAEDEQRERVLRRQAKARHEDPEAAQDGLDTTDELEEAHGG